MIDQRLKSPRFCRTVLAVAVMVAAAACSGPDQAVPAPATTTSIAPATSMATTVVVPTTLDPGVPRSTTTIVQSLGPGDAALSGTVSGPEGPVAGAVVRVERLVGGRPAVADLRTDDEGSWNLSSVLGGPYRVGAYRLPDLGLFEPQQFFLGAAERRAVGIMLTRFGENTIIARVDPTPPKTNISSRLTVRVGTGRIGDDGALVIDAVPFVRLQLVSEGLAIESPVQQTDGDGRVSWNVRCLGVGAFAVALVVGNGITAVPFPACIEGPAPAPTVPPTVVANQSPVE